MIGNNHIDPRIARCDYGIITAGTAISGDNQLETGNTAILRKTIILKDVLEIITTSLLFAIKNAGWNRPVLGCPIGGYTV